jgi:L-alanine-DL-glutamate epimerase-like enolase superfamily enzyme
MRKVTRRSFMYSMTAPMMAAKALAGAGSGIRIKQITHEYEDFLYRTPIKFGGTVLDRVTLLNVRCIVEGAGGRTASGFGSMPMGNVWAFPSKRMSYDVTLGAMKELAERIERISADFKETGHPIDINLALEPEYLRSATEVAGSRKLLEPIPKLCVLVTASPYDAALHDAFGKLHGLSCYRTYGRNFMAHDLSRYLSPEFKGQYLDRYVRQTPQPSMPLYHLVGAVDALTDSDIKQRINDGLPETLPEWIRYNGLTHIKIKLNGEDITWDVGRVLNVDRLSAEAQAQRRVQRWYYSLDFNEKCASVDYLLDFLRQIREKAPACFTRIQYIEQPTARDLRANRNQAVHQAARLKPVVIDESLTDLESLLIAREMGYTGVALKACKGQSQALLMAAAAQKYNLFLCVQDLTCPGASLIQSAGLAAHVPGVHAIEANSRQYVPAANRPWESRFPGIFKVTSGMLRTGTLTGPGLGATPA